MRILQKEITFTSSPQIDNDYTHSKIFCVRVENKNEHELSSDHMKSNNEHPHVCYVITTIYCS